MGDFVHIPKATLLHVVDMLASGIPIRKIAAEFEYSASTISNRVFEEGLPHNIGLAKEWVCDRDTAWSRQLEDVVDANDGIEIAIAGRPELASLDVLKSDLGFRNIPISSLIEAVFEWDGDFWRLVRGRYYPVTTAISLRWATKLTTGKQIVEALNKVRLQEERVRFQARIWLHKLPSEGLHIYPATIVSKGYPLYRKAA